MHPTRWAIRSAVGTNRPFLAAVPMPDAGTPMTLVSGDRHGY